MRILLRVMVAACLLLGGVFVAVAQVTPKSQMERLDRGIVAVPSNGIGQFVSWRLLGTDDDNVVFDLYRDGAIIGKNLNGATSYNDSKGSASSQYKVVAKVGDTVIDQSAVITPWSDMYKVLQLDRPSSKYTPNDMSVGDVDGDGQYELFVKWDPDDSKDNANTGTSSPCIIDCYRLDGTKLWRINLGSNIRSGAHYTQFMVYDFDADGRAEIICKTAPGSVDGKGNYVSAAADDNTIKSTNNATSYVSGGRILSGPEFLTVFDGQTGAARHTIWYNPNRAGNYGKADNYPSNSSFWGGDTNGNRGDRHLAAVAYLDANARTASAIFCRGYYARAYVWAVDYIGGKLKHRWLHCSSSETAYSVTDVNFNTANYNNAKSTSGQGSATMYANGNHNISIADVDGDGKDEIIWGSAACDDNGRLLYGVGFGHGDAMHLADLVPDRPGLEVFDVHEKKGTYAWDVHDARTGQVLLKGGPSGIDNGRGLAAQVSPDHRESFFSSSGDNQSRSCATGEVVSQYGPLINNFRIFWDGDLQEELLGDISKHNNPILEKWNGNGYSRMYPKRNTNLYQIAGSKTINGTKGVPCLQADILGDWREEMVFYEEADPSKVHLFTTNITTNYRVVTLMHDHVYRMGIVWQNVAYNQPPHLGYYLPDYVKMPEQEVDNSDDSQLTDILLQDYEQESDGATWKLGATGRGEVKLVTDDEKFGKYISFSTGVNNGSNPAYTLLSSGDATSYVLQFDVAFGAGNTDGSEFVVMTDGGLCPAPNGNPHWQSYISYNGRQNSLFAVTYNNSEKIGHINYTDTEFFEMSMGTWYHVRLEVNGTNRSVNYIVSDYQTRAIKERGTYQLPEGTSGKLMGIYMQCGRSYGYTNIDNIRVSSVAVPEPEPEPDPEPVIVNPVDPQLMFTASSAVATLGMPFTVPTLLNQYAIEVEWNSENEQVATVDEQGKVTLLGAGKTIITASFFGSDDYTSSQAQYELTVRKPDPVASELTFGTVTKDSVVLGEEYVSPTLTNPHSVTVAWTSSNPAVATVNDQGVVTVVGAGETIISAAFAGNDDYLAATVSYKLVVTEPEPEPEPEPDPEPEPEPISDGIGTMMSDVSVQPIFTMTGQRISKLRKGLNIVNGKKIVVK